MSNEKMREEFEAWARKMSMDLEYRNIPGVGQFYECPRTLLALEAWQASREALVIELPEEDPAGWGPGDCGDGRPSEEQYIAAHCNMVLKKFRKSIESAGVKVRIDGRESLKLEDDAIAKGFAHCVFNEEILNVAYWDFDARIKGYPPYGVPSGNQAHAFKTAVFAAIEAAGLKVKE